MALLLAIIACLFFVGILLYIAAAFFPLGYFVIGVLLSVLSGFLIFVDRIRITAAQGGSFLSVLLDVASAQKPVWRRVLDAVKAVSIWLFFILVWPIVTCAFFVYAIYGFRLLMSIPTLPARQQLAYRASTYPAFSMISSVLLAVFSAANLFAYVYWQTVSNVTHPSVVLAFNLLLALTLLYISYLVDLRPLQQRFRRWDCNIILHFAFLLASNLIALVLSAYTINLWQSNAMASIESLYAVMWKVITYRQFWTPSRWLEASAGDLLIAAATTAFYLSVVASAWRVGEFARTLDDWTALAQQKTLVGEPDRALKLLGNVHTNTEEVRRVRAAALVGVGEAEQAWREIERAVEMRLNEVDADVAFLSYLEVASEFTTSTQMAMKAFCVAVAKGISDGRVALMVGDLLGSGKFDNSIFESACTDSAKYPLARIAVNVIQGRVNEAGQILDRAPQYNHTRSFDPVDAVMARLLRMMYEIKKADNKNGARSSLDIQIEGYIEEVSGRLKEARQSGTALLLIVLLVTILEVAVRLGSSRVPQLSFAVDKALEPLSSARGLSVLVDVLRVRKERARNLSRQLAG